MIEERIQSELALPFPLRPYQWEGVRFLFARDSALLADEMGLGKTIQVAVSLDLLFRTEAADRALIVAPASLRLNWKYELSRWTQGLSVRVLDGKQSERAAMYGLPVHVLVASYDQIRADSSKLDPTSRFSVVVLDEAQYIKNEDSVTALACRSLPRNRSWALTGTPVENSHHDLIAVFRFVRPGLLNDGMPMMELQRRMQPYFLRRRKSDVLPELPPIITQNLSLTLSGRQKAAYEAVWKDRRQDVSSDSSITHLFAMITRLKQLCNFDPESGQSVKLDAVNTVIDGLFSSGDKMIVFSQYVRTLQWLAPRLSKRIPVEIFDGSLSSKERDATVTRFSREPGPRALLISIRAGGTGLNIPEANVVVMFDRWWNPAAEDQAIHRAHRFGRHMPLQVIRFLVADSIEERIHDILVSKRDLFDQAIERAQIAGVPPFSRSDLLKVLGIAVHNPA